MATGAVQQDLYCYTCDSRRSALPPHYIGENQDVRACPVCESDFVELVDAAPPSPPQPPPGPIDGQGPLGGGFPAGPAHLLHMMFTRPDGSTVAFNELMGDTFVEGPGGLHFNMAANQGGFSIGDFAFGSMERLIEAITAMDQQEERPTEQTFLDALPHVLVTRRTSCDLADDPSANPQTSADAGEGPVEGLPDPGPDSQRAAKELASSKHAVVGEQCTICHEAYGHNHEVVELPCNHCFHEDCILPWLKSHHTCPVCRFKLPQGPPRIVNPPHAGQQVPGQHHGGQEPFAFAAGAPGGQQAEGGAGRPQGQPLPMHFGPGGTAFVHQFMQNLLPHEFAPQGPFGPQMIAQQPQNDPLHYAGVGGFFGPQGPQMPPMGGDYDDYSDEEYSDPGDDEDDEDEGYSSYEGSLSNDEMDADSLRSHSPAYMRPPRSARMGADNDDMPSLETDSQEDGAIPDLGEPGDGDGTSEYEEDGSIDIEGDSQDEFYARWRTHGNWRDGAGVHTSARNLPPRGDSNDDMPPLSDGVTSSSEDLPPLAGSNGDMPALSDGDMPPLLDYTDSEEDRREPRNTRNVRRRRVDDDSQPFGGLARGFLAGRGPARAARREGAPSGARTGRGRAVRVGGALPQGPANSSLHSVPAVLIYRDSEPPRPQRGRRRARPSPSRESDPGSLPALSSGSDWEQPPSQRARHSGHADLVVDSGPESLPDLSTASESDTPSEPNAMGSRANTDIASTSSQRAAGDVETLPVLERDSQNQGMVPPKTRVQTWAGNGDIAPALAPDSENNGVAHAGTSGQSLVSGTSWDIPAAGTSSSHAPSTAEVDRGHDLQHGSGEGPAPLTAVVSGSGPEGTSGARLGTGDAASAAAVSMTELVEGWQGPEEGRAELAVGASPADDERNPASDEASGSGRGSLLLGGFCTVAALACAGLMAVFRVR